MLLRTLQVLTAVSTLTMFLLGPSPALGGELSGEGDGRELKPHKLVDGMSSEDLRVLDLPQLSPDEPALSNLAARRSPFHFHRHASEVSMELKRRASSGSNLAGVEFLRSIALTSGLSLGELPESCTDSRVPGDLVEELAYDASAAGERWPRRESNALRAALSPSLAESLGTLYFDLRVAHCIVEKARSLLPHPMRTDQKSGATNGAEPKQRAREFDAKNIEDWRGLFAVEEHREAVFQATAQLNLAGLIVDEAVIKAVGSLVALSMESWPVEPLVLGSPMGPLWIGSPSNNSGSGDPFLLVDPDGDDQWRIAADRADLKIDSLHPVRVWIDLGGNDSWSGGDGGPGGALLSVASGLELGGDDTYRSGRFSLGAALVGSASWVDQGGNDTYRTDEFSQGAAGLGFAALVDGSGNDIYDVDDIGQAYATMAGAAFLHDRSGDDLLLNRSVGQGAAASFTGVPPALLAWLQDDSGDDRYLSAGAAQAICLEGGLALVWDHQGDDLRHVDAGSLNWAAGSCAAFLTDFSGDDTYRATGGVGQASGSSLSLLYDPEGDDSYLASEGSLAQARRNSLALIDDRSGRNHLRSPPNSTVESADWAHSMLPTGQHHELPATQTQQDIEAQRYARSKRLMDDLSEDLSVLSELSNTQTVALLEALDMHLRADPEFLEKSLALIAALSDSDDPAIRRSSLNLRRTILSLPDVQLDSSETTRWGSLAIREVEESEEVLPRVSAIQLLSELQLPAASGALAARLGPGHYSERRAAELALKRLANGGHGLVVARAVFPLAEAPVEGLSDPLGTTKDEPTHRARLAALRLLGTTNHREAIDVLIAALDDPDPAVRVAALSGADTLQDRGLKSAIQELKESETHPSVRRALELEPLP